MPELHLANLVKERTTTEGTGAVSLGGALDGHQSFADSPITDGQTVAYRVFHLTVPTEWEIGYGTFDATAGTLSRDTVLDSPTDAKIDFSAGNKVVFVGLPSEEILLEGTAETISGVWDFAGGVNAGGVQLADGSGNIPDGRVPQSAVSQHEAALSVAGSQVDSGTLPDARIQESGVTQYGTAALEVPWSNTVVVEGDNSTRTTRATEVQAAITEAAGASKSFVFVPHSFLNYNASAVPFDNSVRMVREGQVGDVYDVKAYGAAGDGVVDDAVALQAAVDAASSNNGVAFLPDGDYRTTSVVQGKANCDIRGSSRENATIQPDHAGRGIEVIGSAGSEIQWRTYSDFAVVGQGASTVGIYCELVGRFAFERIKSIDHTSHGIQYFDSWSPTFVECRVTDNGGSGLFMDGGPNHNVSNPTVRGGSYDRNTLHGIHYTSPSHAGQYHGLGCASNSRTGIFIEDGKSPVVRSCFLEFNGDATWPAIQIATASFQNDSPIIESNFLRSSGSDADVGIKVVRGDSGVIRGNRYDTFTTAVKVESDTDNTVLIGPGFMVSTTNYLDYQGSTFTDDEQTYFTDDAPIERYIVGNGASGLQVHIENTGGASGGTLWRLYNEGSEVFRIGRDGMPNFGGGAVPTRQTYTPSNVATDRSYDADSTTTAELADVLGTLIADLQASGLLA